MKELPATLLLRPLNFETLATHLYGEAARGTYEDGSIAAVCIVLFGLVPVMMLARISRRPSMAIDQTSQRAGADAAMAELLMVPEAAPRNVPEAALKNVPEALLKNAPEDANELPAAPVQPGGARA